MQMCWRRREVQGDKMGEGENISLSDEVKEGKINFNSEIDGILKVDTEKLFELNMLEKQNK